MSSFQCEKCGVIHCDNGKDGYSLHQGELKTITTFEELARKTSLDIKSYVRSERDFVEIKIKGSDTYLKYYKDGGFLISSYCNFKVPVISIQPQQAYNIITALKNNLGD